MERTLKIVNMVVLGTMIAFLLDYFSPILSFSLAFVGDFAISMEDGGIMAAAGFWDVPMPFFINLISKPVCGILLALMAHGVWVCLAGKYRLDLLLGGNIGDGSCYYIFAYLCSFIGAIMVSMAVRYQTWHDAGFR